MMNIINSLSRKFEFKVHVTTGDKRGAGTDSTVFFQLVDSSGASTEPTRLNHVFTNDHERGDTHTYELTSAGLRHPDSIDHIIIWRDKFGLKDDWFLDRVEVEEIHQAVKKHYIFPVQRWIVARRKYIFYEFDTFLPQNDPQPEFRSSELKERKNYYEFRQNIKDGPLQVKNLPSQEMFSLDYEIEILILKNKLKWQKFFLTLGKDRWESIEQMKGIFLTNTLQKPRSLEHWQDDKWFALQRVQGVNPTLLKLCTQLPEKFTVTSEMVEPFLDHLNLEDAIDSRCIFIVDFEILHKLPLDDNNIMVSPIALFYRSRENELLPIAIQLYQEPGPENPVYMPSDPPYTWLMAKMFFNMADAQVHQGSSHLGLTHLLMESMCVSTNRNLSPSHPVFRLLAPHFLYLLAINTKAIDVLISPGGYVDRSTTSGKTGFSEIVKRGFGEWNINVQGDVEQEIKSRGLLDPSILSYYPYRDDAVALFRIIKKYVTSVVHHYYDTPQKLTEDWEVQAWVQEMSASQKHGGLGIGGVPNHVDSVDQLAKICTAIVSTCSLMHAAVNFQQYDEYAFIPNFPGMLMGVPPATKREITEEEFLEFIPNKEVTLDLMSLTKILSMKGTKSLGDFEVQFLYEPEVILMADEFRLELKKLSHEIKERNKTAEFKYEWLDPEFVPNSISI